MPAMDDFAQLPVKQQQQLLRALEEVPDIASRADFFLWSQGSLKLLLPHGLLIGLLFDERQQALQLECLQSVPYPAELLDKLRHPEHGYLARLARSCDGPGVMLLGEATAAPPLKPAAPALAMEWQALNFGYGLLLASGPLIDGVSSFIGLFGLQGAPSATQGWLLRVLAPQLHFTLMRIKNQPAGAPDPNPNLVEDLTDRQLQILEWVKMGKTNYEISLILDISALTVKNHLQKLFKRLNVHNRAQAVARLMELPAGRGSLNGSTAMGIVRTGHASRALASDPVTQVQNNT
jgi:transcriptional regulator EpsA